MKRIAGLPLLAAMVACMWSTGCPRDPASPSGMRTCDPLASAFEPIQLEEVLGIGRSSDGTIVVVDRSASASANLRLFLSDGDELVRHEVAGTGESNADGKESYLITSTDGTEPMRVLLERADATVHMKLAMGADVLGDKSFDFGTAPGESLEILDDSALTSLQVQNLPGTIDVEYFAHAGDDRLVVTRPATDFTYDEFRLFFGAPGHVREHKIRNVERALDGGSTQIEFDLDGADAKVFFPNRLTSDSPPITEPVTFDVSGKPRSIAREANDDAELEDLHFECF